MLLIHYDEIKQIPVAGREASNQLSPVECHTLANIFIRQLLLHRLRSCSKLPVTLTTCWPLKARKLPIMKRLKENPSNNLKCDLLKHTSKKSFD